MDSIKINGMSCEHCVGSVTKTLESIEGLSNVTVNLNTATATFENNSVERQVIQTAVKKIGFQPGD